MREFIQWTAPSPLWESAIRQNSAAVRRAALSRPGILRFATDSFMDDFLQMLERNPKKLDQYVAEPETWRGIAPPPEILKPVPAFARSFQRLGRAAKKKRENASAAKNQPAQIASSAEPESPLKLYQPAHQRFYLVAACLVCERAGLPDKALNPGREEKVSFVIRRLFPKGELNVNDPLPDFDATWEEHAFVLTGQGGKWRRIEDQKKNILVETEELLPLFSVNFTEDDGRRRKLFAGVVPAGKREAYMAAGKAAAKTSDASTVSEAAPDSRILLMRAIFRDPWKSLLQIAAHAVAAINEKPDGKNQPGDVINNLIKGSREQIQAVSWLILLDFANYLAENLPRVWRALNSETVSPALSAAEINLVGALENTRLSDAFAIDLAVPGIYTANQVRRTLKNALLAVKPKTENPPKKIENDLEAVTVSYNRAEPDALYPDFLFPLADCKFALTTVSGGATVPITPTDFAANDFDGETRVNAIAKLVEDALPPKPSNQPLQATPLAAETPMDMREGFYVIRCVYERPLCGALDPPVVSAPTRAFQLAGFFDPDAPARPIRIALPIDTTPAGLRKFNKNTAFMMSDLLCGQVNRMKGITFGDLIRSVLPFPLHKDLSVPDGGGCKSGGLSIGMMCSLSIPIITICALILLMIIVSLLDFIFRWLPFFILCFPLPGLKGKK